MEKEKSVSTPIVIAVAIVIVLIGAYLTVSSNEQAGAPSAEMPAPSQSSTPAATPPIATSTGASISPGPSAPTSSASASSASASNLKITRPAGGEQWTAGQSYIIRWNGQPFLGTHEGYNFELSLMQGDRGKGIITSADNVPMDGANYLWTIPKDTPPGIYEITVVEYQFVACPAAASSTLCRQWAFQFQSQPFTIVAPNL